jgi:hypothetical protein
MDSVSSESSIEYDPQTLPLWANNCGIFNFDDFLQATYENSYLKFESEARQRNALVDTYTNTGYSHKWQQQYAYNQRQEELNQTFH